jgi:prolyl-tRNA synthetase
MLNKIPFQADETDPNLQNADTSVLLDNRDERTGVKFYDADLID